MVQTHARATVARMPNPRSRPLRASIPVRARCSSTPILLALLVVLSGCDRNVEPYQPGEEAREPDLGRIFPGAPGGPGAPTGAGDEVSEGVAMAGAQGTTRGAVPPSRAEGSQVDRSTASAAAPIEGSIELADGISGPAGGVLFVIARPQGAQGGPPLAVLRIADPSFPLEFSIGPDNVMIPSMRFEGAISLSARLDEDGNAMTRGAADLSSPTEEPLSPGTRGVLLVLGGQG